MTLVITTDAQVRQLMKELQKHGNVAMGALRSGMDRKTARKYRNAGKLPSELKKSRHWRTRVDPLAPIWGSAQSWLEVAPELEALALFEWLTQAHPGQVGGGHLRTFQRRVKQWRAKHGPEREVFFSQQHRPGEAMQTDFTNANELGVTLGGEAFPHLLCHVVLPFSNWQFATVARSESLMALRRGMQRALLRLGHRPEFSQTDNSTAATHDAGEGRKFNVDYLAVMAHFGLKARTIEIGKSNQNGDVEAHNGALKRRLKQHLLLRRSTDFDDVEQYEAFVARVVDDANALRKQKIEEELAAMTPLTVSRLPEYIEVDAVVTSWSTIRVKRNAYSLPSRLIGETVRVHLYDDRLEAYYGGVMQEIMPRLLGDGGQRIDYRHIIWSLMKKPGAFARYRYREELFPSLLFRRAYDALSVLGDRDADLHYLRILHVAASTLQSEVEAALAILLEGKCVPRIEAVKDLCFLPEQRAARELPKLAPFAVNLCDYDELLGAAAVGT